MAANTNRIVITGNLGGDPEAVDYTDRQGNPARMARFSVAVNRFGQNNDVDWFNVKVWGNQSGPVLEHLSKGRTVCVTGRMESNKGTGQHEGKVFWDLVADSVEFIGPRPDGAAPAAQPAAQPAQAF